MLSMSQAPQEVDDFKICQPNTRGLVAPVQLQKRRCVVNNCLTTFSCLHYGPFRSRKCLQLSCPILDSRLMVNGFVLAVGLHVCQDVLIFSQILLGCLKVPSSCGVNPCSFMLAMFGFVKLLVIYLDLVFQGLFKKFEVVPAIHLLAPQFSQLCNSFLFEIIQYINNVFAALFVDNWVWHIYIHTIILLFLVVLHKPQQHLLVMDGHGGCINNRRHRFDKLVNIVGIQLGLDHC
mmetsp:Transcript_811/g.1451  ORF Transcript_811/g.1451 Transcript_811/m.1451 type:complete len:234 (-) Transcript_811:479-1180(-)